MRQAGVLAAPGLLALRDMVERLPEDHAAGARLAEAVAAALARLRARSRLGAHQHRDLRPRRAGQAAGAPGRRGRAGGTIAPGTVRLVTHHDVDDGAGRLAVHAIAALEDAPMKIRIGISAGGEDLGPDAMAALGQGSPAYGFDSLWLPEVLSRPGPDPLVGLAWASGACPGLKIGTTMLLPGRNLVWLAKAVATLDQLSGGRFLLTFVPGLADRR
jgi:hypothetical protein